MNRLNDAYFTPAALQVARGATDPSNDGWPEPNGGIIAPKRVHLAIRNKYYRFASSSRPRSEQLYGGWWIEFEVLKKIARFAKEHSDPRHAVRYFLALPWSWSACDKLVSGFLTMPMDAYRGEGKPVMTAPEGHARDGGTNYIPPQNSKELYQLYIPGMRQVGAQAFAHLATEDIWRNKNFR